jgi:hypothetical protein
MQMGITRIGNLIIMRMVLFNILASSYYQNKNRNKVSGVGWKMGCQARIRPTCGAGTGGGARQKCEALRNL